MANTALHALFYAEFDIILGPRIIHQSPRNALSELDFDMISEFVITKPDLCGRVVTVVHPLLSTTRQAATVVSFPVGLHGDKYPRNTLLFSVGFVLAAAADTAPFEPVLRKLALALAQLEIESELLLRSSRTPLLGGILDSILSGLSARGECFVAVDSADTIALKLLPSSSMRARRTVRDTDVPVRLRDLDVLMGGTDDEGGGWDLCLRSVVPHIDGVAFVRAIAEAADMETCLVREAMAHLLAYGLIAMVDVFTYENVYATRPRVALLLRSAELRDACVTFVSTSGGSDGPGSSHPSFPYVFGLYTAFGAGSRAGDVCGPRDTAGHGVVDSKLASFGVLHGLLRRVHKFAVPTTGGGGGGGTSACRAAVGRALAAVLRRPPPGGPSSPSSSSSSAAPAAGTPLLEELREVDATTSSGGPGPVLPLPPLPPPALLLALFDGTHSMEECCCTLQRSQAHVEAAVAACGDAFVYVLR